MYSFRTLLWTFAIYNFDIGPIPLFSADHSLKKLA